MTIKFHNLIILNTKLFGLMKSQDKVVITRPFKGCNTG